MTEPRRRARSKWASLLVVLVATAAGAKTGPSGAAGGASLPELDLESLEPAVAEQLGALREHVEGVLASEATVAEGAEAVGELGRHYHAYQLTELAEVCFRAAADLAPRDFRWRYHLAYLLQQTGRLEEAAAGYERALGLLPEVPPALIRLGQVYKDLNRPEAAIDVLSRAYELDPSASAALATLGEVYLSQSRHAEAVQVLEKALELENGANRLYYPLALAYRGLGEEETARQLLSRRGKVGVRPADPLIDGMSALTTGERVHLLRGRSAFGAGRFPEAVAEFRAAVEADPESIPALVNLGSALAQTGDFDGAIAAFRRAIDLAPGNHTARFNLGTLLASQGELEEAVEELRGAVSYAPEDGAAHRELGAVLARLDRHEEALVHHALAVRHAPQSEEARLGQVRSLIALERWQEALESLEKAHRSNPSSGRLAYALARFLAASPRPELRDGERAVELAQKVYAARASLAHGLLVAEALAESGRCDEAADWQRRVMLDAGDAVSDEDQGKLAYRLSRYEDVRPCRPPAESEPERP